MHLQLNNLESQILIHGDNGAGKTNILEAISYLSPGRGLRSAKYHDLCNLQNEITSPYWTLKAKTQELHISMAYSSQSKVREVLLNETKMNSLELGKLHNIVWITPQMDRLFASNATDRRKFLDRLAYAHDKNHAVHLKQYDRLLKERLSHLMEHSYDEKLLQIFENQIAELAVKIFNTRHSFVQKLQKALSNIPTELPKIHLALESMLSNQPNTHTFIATKLNQNRKLDKISEKTIFAPHRIEFNALINHNTPAKLCSTGQQKIILISIIMAHVSLLQQSSPSLPIILLLDEIFVHLDIKFRELVSSWLNTNSTQNIQSWITTTDLESFSFIDTSNATIMDITTLATPK